MRLNILNDTVIAEKIIQKINVDNDITLNEDLSSVKIHPSSVYNGFKVSSSVIPTSGVICSKIDLGKLLEGIPLDISQPVYNDCENNHLYSELISHCDVNVLEEVPLLDTVDFEVPTDILSDYFITTMRLLGITNLYTGEVKLTLVGDTLHVDIHRSKVYFGQFKVKVK